MLRNKAALRSKQLRHSSAAAITVDVDAVKAHWNSLDADERLRVIHFRDHALVERVGRVQESLCASDLECHRLGIRGQDAVRRETGIHEFALEREEKNKFRFGFYATPDFVGRADLFEHIESRLGRSFLKGRPILRRVDWVSVLEPTANSWAGFMTQVLELVELAIFQAYHDSMALAQSAAKVGVEDESAQVLSDFSEPSELKKPTGSTPKRKARKKRINIARAAAAALPDPQADDLDDALGLAEAAAAAAAVDKAPIDDLDCASSLQVTTLPDGSLTDDLQSLSTWVDEDNPESALGVSVLNFDWMPEGPPIDEATDNAHVELEVDWSEGGANQMQTRWSAWLANGLTGSAAEWHWESNGNDPTVAFLKNTFVETMSISSEGSSRLRVRSLPARYRDYIERYRPGEVLGRTKTTVII